MGDLTIALTLGQWCRLRWVISLKPDEETGGDEVLWFLGGESIFYKVACFTLSGNRSVKIVSVCRERIGAG